MKIRILKRFAMAGTALFALIMPMTASATDVRTLTELTLTDLNDQTHHLPKDWQATGGVLILGFAHNARADMDLWRDDLKLSQDAQWIEAPIVGNVSALIQPMIKGGMKGKYAGKQRDHVTPVFANADVIRKFEAARTGDVVVLVVNSSGQIVDRAEGKPDAAAVERLSVSYAKLRETATPTR